MNKFVVDIGKRSPTQTVISVGLAFGRGRKGGGFGAGSKKSYILQKSPPIKNNNALCVAYSLALDCWVITYHAQIVNLSI